jgi:hypothetical protein
MLPYPVARWRGRRWGIVQEPRLGGTLANAYQRLALLDPESYGRLD